MPRRLRTTLSSEDLSPNRSTSVSAHDDQGSLVEQHRSKYLYHTVGPLRAKMKCSLPPHPDVLSFPTLEDFEVHYQKAHANRCSECKKNFPSEHFLDLHIGENHDPLNDARKSKGEKTYRCFVEDCEKICSTPEKRKMHLTSEKHMFPKNYDFLIVNTGIDKRSSMLRGKHQKLNSQATALHKTFSADDNNKPESNETMSPNPIDDTTSLGHTKQTANDGETSVEDLTTSLSSLKFVPPSVRFGRGGRRGGFARS